jgi:hypothetical protein
LLDTGFNASRNMTVMFKLHQSNHAANTTGLSDYANNRDSNDPGDIDRSLYNFARHYNPCRDRKWTDCRDVRFTQIAGVDCAWMRSTASAPMPAPASAANVVLRSLSSAFSQGISDHQRGPGFCSRYCAARQLINLSRRPLAFVRKRTALRKAHIG